MPSDTGHAAEPAGAIDPFLGEFTVFERRANGFIESRRYGGRITIEKYGEGCKLSYANREVVFEVNKFGVLEPESIADSGIREIRSTVIGRPLPGESGDSDKKAFLQMGMELMESFQVLYLVRGVGPSSWWDPNDWTHQGKKPEDIWDYKRTVSHAGSRSERVHGELTVLGKPVDARPGDILFTPIGKFMYFGLPNRFDHSTGWLNATTYDTELFNDDGSFTDAGTAARASLTDKTRPLTRTPINPDEYMMPGERLKPVMDAVKPGMTREQVRAAVDKHFEEGGAVRVGSYLDGPEADTYHEQYSLYTQWGQGSFTVSYLPKIDRGPPDPSRELEPLKVSVVRQLP